MTPYVAALESRIIENYGRVGVEVVAARRLDLSVNTAYADVSEDSIEDMVRDVNAAGPDAIIVMCTNLRFAVRSQSLRREFATPIIDSVAATIDACLAFQNGHERKS